MALIIATSLLYVEYIVNACIPCRFLFEIAYAATYAAAVVVCCLLQRQSLHNIGIYLIIGFELMFMHRATKKETKRTRENVPDFSYFICSCGKKIKYGMNIYVHKERKSGRCMWHKERRQRKIIKTAAK